MALIGINLIINKKFRTSGAAVRSDTVRIFNCGPGRMDDAIWITGPSPTSGGFKTGILFSPCNAEVGIDMQYVEFGVAAIRLTGQPIVLSLNADGSPHERIYGGGDGIRLATSLGGRSLFATDNANSTLAVSHPASGQVDFLDGTGEAWLVQDQLGVTFQKQVSSRRTVHPWAESVTLDFSLGAVHELTLSGATVWGKETRFGLATVDLLRRRGGAEDPGTSRVIRCVAGVDVARDRRWLWTSRLGSRLW